MAALFRRNNDVRNTSGDHVSTQHTGLYAHIQDCAISVGFSAPNLRNCDPQLLAEFQVAVKEQHKRYLLIVIKEFLFMTRTYDENESCVEYNTQQVYWSETLYLKCFVFRDTLPKMKPSGALLTHHREIDTDTEYHVTLAGTKQFVYCMVEFMVGIESDISS